MAECYHYSYPGTREEFTAQIFSDPEQTLVQFDPYLISRTEDGQIEIGLGQGGSGGGYWYVHTCREEDGRLLFSGTVEYIDYYYHRRQNSRFWRIFDGACEGFLKLLLLPLWPIGWISRKKHPEESDERILDRLMVEHLRCEKMK